VKLESVAFVYPEQCVSNEDVIALVRSESRRTYSGDIGKLTATIATLLEESGARTRYWRPASSKSVLPYIQRSFTEALSAAGLRGSDVDALIYSSVDRGFIEPGDSYFVAQAIGLDRVGCFDIIDACNGWCRATQIAQALMFNGEYNRVAVINSEFALWNDGIVKPHCFRLTNRKELPWSFPAYTLGEGVTTTILSRDDSTPWVFATASRPDLCDLCTVPLQGYQQHVTKADRIGLRGPFTFTSFGFQMIPEAEREIASLIKALGEDVVSCKRIFPHTASVKAYAGPAERLGIARLMFYIYPEYGNVVSASVPAGIAIADKRGEISRRDRLGVVVASAGMSFTVCMFEY
jgi:3-oxoacyl-[acyl-carrier-protein] synthase III